MSPYRSRADGRSPVGPAAHSDQSDGVSRASATHSAFLTRDRGVLRRHGHLIHPSDTINIARFLTSAVVGQPEPFTENVSLQLADWNSRGGEFTGTE